MLYLLDANVLIDAERDYYPLDRVPQFWAWLVTRGAEGLIRIPVETLEEISIGTDALAAWAKSNVVISALRFDEEVDPALVSRVVSVGYASDLTDEEIDRVGRDPFLVAHALVAPTARVVVTTERSAPSKQRANRKLPDVCAGFGVSTNTTFGLIRLLDFRA